MAPKVHGALTYSHESMFEDLCRHAFKLKDLGATKAVDFFNPEPGVPGVDLNYDFLLPFVLRFHGSIPTNDMCHEILLRVCETCDNMGPLAVKCNGRLMSAWVTAQVHILRRSFTVLKKQALQTDKSWSAKMTTLKHIWLYGQVTPPTADELALVPALLDDDELVCDPPMSAIIDPVVPACSPSASPSSVVVPPLLDQRCDDASCEVPVCSRSASPPLAMVHVVVPADVVPPMPDQSGEDARYDMCPAISSDSEDDTAAETSLLDLETAARPAPKRRKWQTTPNAPRGIRLWRLKRQVRAARAILAAAPAVDIVLEQQRRARPKKKAKAKAKLKAQAKAKVQAKAQGKAKAKAMVKAVAKVRVKKNAADEHLQASAAVENGKSKMVYVYDKKKYHDAKQAFITTSVAKLLERFPGNSKEAKLAAEEAWKTSTEKERALDGMSKAERVRRRFD